MDVVNEQRCAVCEETVDVLDVCEACSMRYPIARSHNPNDPCRYGHERRWSKDRWRCDECSNRLRRLSRLKAKTKT